MRRKLLSLVLAGTVAGVGSVSWGGETLRGQSPTGGGFFEPYVPNETSGHFEEQTGSVSWYDSPDYGMTFKAGIQWLSRSADIADKPLIVDLPPGSSTLLSTGDIDLNGQFQPGALFQLGFNFDQVSGVDLVYWGLNDFSTSRVVTSVNPMGLAGTLQNSTVDYVFSDLFKTSYSSYLNNAEANYRQTIESFTLLAGFRYFGLREDLTIQSRSAQFGTTSDYRVEAQNNLVGGQIGGAYNWDWWRFRFTLDTKFAVAANTASQETFLGDYGNTIVRRSYRAESLPVSCISDSSIGTKLRLTDWLAIETAYRFMWVSNLAFAPNQLDLSDSPAGTEVMNASSDLWLNGLLLGIDCRW